MLSLLLSLPSLSHLHLALPLHLVLPDDDDMGTTCCRNHPGHLALMPAPPLLILTLAFPSPLVSPEDGGNNNNRTMIPWSSHHCHFCLTLTLTPPSPSPSTFVLPEDNDGDDTGTTILQSSHHCCDCLIVVLPPCPT